MELRRYDQLQLACLSFVLILASFFPTVSAQSLDPNSVPSSTRNAWCQGNTQACSLLCIQGTSANTCDSDALTYECTCSDGSSPDLANYALTLPYFVCMELRSQCVANNANAFSQEDCNAVQCADATPGADSGGGGAVSSTPTTNAVSNQPPPTEAAEPNSETPPAVLDPISTSTVPEFTSSASTTSSPTSQSSDTPSSTEQISSTSSSAGSTTGSRDPSATSTSPGAGETETGDPGAGGRKRGISTAAIIGIAVGLGVPALLVLLFLVYRWGGQSAQQPPTMPPAAPDKPSQWQGGNEISGGGAYPGIGNANEVGGIEDGHYIAENRWNTGRQY